VPVDDSILGLCGSIQQLCTGSNLQYKDVAECVNVLHTKRFGIADELWGDDVVCRFVHVLLARIRPEVHCPHVGPTGGGKCVDVQYDQVYFEDDQVLFEGVGDNIFMCGK